MPLAETGVCRQRSRCRWHSVIAASVPRSWPVKSTSAARRAADGASAVSTTAQPRLPLIPALAWRAVRGEASAVQGQDRAGAAAGVAGGAVPRLAAQARRGTRAVAAPRRPAAALYGRCQPSFSSFSGHRSSPGPMSICTSPTSSMRRIRRESTAIWSSHSTPPPRCRTTPGRAHPMWSARMPGDFAIRSASPADPASTVHVLTGLP